MSTNTKSILLIIASITTFGFLILTDNSNVYSIRVLILNFIICSWSLINLFAPKSKPFSLFNISQIFFLFFVGLAPALQFKNDVFFLGEQSKLEELDFFQGNLIFLSAITLYNGVYYFMNHRFKNNVFKNNNYKKTLSVLGNKQIVTVSILCCVLFIIYVEFKIEPVYFRGYFLENKANYNSSLLSIFNILRGAPLVLFIFYKQFSKQNLYTELLLLTAIIFCNFPTGIPRFRIAVIYFPLALIYIKFLYKKFVFTIGFILSLVSIFPFLHQFRYSITSISSSGFFDFKMFIQAHFDSYQNSINVILKSIITNGEQLLTTLLFFIPRSIWKDKALGSGHVLAEHINYDGFSNVAVSYFAEGFINFGYYGIVLFIIILAIINFYLDKFFWDSESIKPYMYAIYLIAIPFQFLLLRGSLLASFANISGYITLIMVLYLLFFKPYKKQQV